MSVSRPSAGAVLLGLIPFAGMCFSVCFWDRIDPMYFGIPFNLLWLLGWVLISVLCLWGAYWLEARRHKTRSSAE
jgi:hypothetical protein